VRQRAYANEQGEEQRERERGSQADSALNVEPDPGLSYDPEIMT